MERLKTVDITSSYGRKKVLCGVDIAAAAGQCVGIVGTNGCGKSTLLNILAGLRRADKGEIYFDGNRAQGREFFIRYVGYVPQESNLIPELSVMDNLRLWYQDAGMLRQSLEQGFLRALGVERMCRMKARRLICRERRISGNIFACISRWGAQSFSPRMMRSIWSCVTGFIPSAEA